MPFAPRALRMAARCVSALHQKALILGTVTLCLLQVLAPCAAQAQDSVAVVAENNVRLREAPSISAAIVSSLERGSTVTIRGREGAWTRVDQGGRTGFVRTSQLGPASASSTTPVADASRRDTAAARATPPPPPRRGEDQRPDQRMPSATATEEQGTRSAAGARPKFSLEANGLQRAFGSTTPFGSTSEFSSATAFGDSGFGFDVQARVRLGLLHIGGGYMSSSHTQAQFTDGGDVQTQWAGPFGEVRLSIPASNRIDVFVAGRGGLANGTAIGSTSGPSGSLQYDATTSGYHAAAGGGIALHLSRNFALVASGLYGLIKTNETKASVRVLLIDGSEFSSEATDNVAIDGRLRTFRVGFAIGF